MTVLEHVITGRIVGSFSAAFSDSSQTQLICLCPQHRTNPSPWYSPRRIYAIRCRVYIIKLIIRKQNQHSFKCEKRRNLVVFGVVKSFWEGELYRGQMKESKVVGSEFLTIWRKDLEGEGLGTGREEVVSN